MAPSSTHRLKELFDRYVRRDLPPSGVEELVSLLGQADAEEALSEPMRRLWEELKSRPVDYAVDWERMYRQISRADDHLSMMTRRRPGLFGWRAAAAVFLVLAGMAVYWSVAYRRPSMAGAAAEVSPAVVMKKDSVGMVGVLSWQTAENKKVIHLPDGSMVILNRQSTVEYRAAGSETGASGTTGAREVVLRGEAYFDIVHRPGQPFLVHTGNIVTRVLGTAFNIKAYPTAKSIEVTVDHGKVQVLKDGANMGLLSDKQQMRYDVGTAVYHAQQVSLKTVMAWKPEEISFDDITMEEAARRIGERFKVGFDFANPALKQCRITATFYMEDDLDQIMTVICGVNQSRFVISAGIVRMDGKGCN
jgi:ferric-dicitrate binding protein FerR (iron transport regulator)